MKEFPDKLTPENKDIFCNYRYNRILAYLRKEITELILIGDENSYFELDKFARNYKVEPNDMLSMTKTISGELESLGWKLKTSFGGTGLFIYSSEKPPSSCYEDEL